MLFLSLERKGLRANLSNRKNEAGAFLCQGCQQLWRQNSHGSRILHLVDANIFFAKTTNTMSTCLKMNKPYEL